MAEILLRILQRFQSSVCNSLSHFQPSLLFVDTTFSYLSSKNKPIEWSCVKGLVWVEYGIACKYLRRLEIVVTNTQVVKVHPERGLNDNELMITWAQVLESLWSVTSSENRDESDLYSQNYLESMYLF